MSVQVENSIRHASTEIFISALPVVRFTLPALSGDSSSVDSSIKFISHITSDSAKTRRRDERYDRHNHGDDAIQQHITHKDEDQGKHHLFDGWATRVIIKPEHPSRAFPGAAGKICASEALSRHRALTKVKND
jgi:hypothetical protein